MALGNRWKVSRYAKENRKRKGTRPRVEGLELRRLLSAVNWIGGATGDWDTAANWSNGTTNAVPTSADDVTIPSNVSITHTTGATDSVNSITSGAGDTLNISAGSISIAATSTLVNLDLSSTLSIAGGTTVTMSGSASQWTAGIINGGGTLLTRAR